MPLSKGILAFRRFDKCPRTGETITEIESTGFRPKRRYKIHLLRIIIIAIALPAMAYALPCQQLVEPSNAHKIPATTTQAIIVQATGGIHANITACERVGKTWKSVLSPSIKGVIGTYGISAIGTKREGDRKTPAGLYPIGEAFGTQPLALHMDYRYITTDDKFIDDVHNPRYNTWVNGKTDAKSYENMLIEPYKLGLVINYNMNPTIPGAGSAIFMHVWRNSTTPTAGCIAMDEKTISTILHWLDKKQHPYVLINQ